MPIDQQSATNSPPGGTPPGIESAVYARYSSEQQDKSSNEDQIRECRTGAQRDHGFIPEANVFADEEVRGATEHRPELDRLMEIVRSGRATFSRLYMFETSRLARNASFAAKLRKFFAFHKIRLHFVRERMDSEASGFAFQHHMKAFEDEQYSGNLGENVSRGQHGQVTRGYTPCGRCYGYRNVPDEHPTKLGMYGRPAVIGVRQVPHQQEVDTILLIYKMYAAGEGGYSYIAQRLNELGIVSPLKAKKNIVRGWNHAAVRTILNNERYQGHVVFGKTSTARNPETGKIVHPRRAESEWMTYEDPMLKIVPDGLWEAVRARQVLVRDTFSGVKAGGMARSSASHSHLFSGLLRCGCCGGSMVLTNGSKGSYKCSNARRKNGCENNLNVRRESLQRQLIGAIALKLRSEINLAHVKSLFMTELSAELKRRDEAAEGSACQRNSLLTEQKQLVVGLENLANEIANYGGSESLRSAMRQKEARMAVVKDLLGRGQSTTKIASGDEV
jgi:DNA invertase Pin-like site-specific DNA recombinase